MTIERLSVCLKLVELRANSLSSNFQCLSCQLTPSTFMNSSSATIDELSLALSFVLDGPKTADESRHDSMYQDGVFSYVWFEAKAFPVILLGSEASVHSDMGAINNAVVCRNSHPTCCMRCCMIFSSAVSACSPFSNCA